MQHLRRPGDTFHLLRIIPLLPYRCARCLRLHCQLRCGPRLSSSTCCASPAAALLVLLLSPLHTGYVDDSGRCAAACNIVTDAFNFRGNVSSAWSVSAAFAGLPTAAPCWTAWCSTSPRM